MGHLALGKALQPAFTVQAGRGSSLTARLGAPPIIANGRVYTIDTLGAVRAFDARTGASVWASQTPDVKGKRGRNLRRRDRLRQWPHLRDQRPRLRRGAERAERWNRLAGASRRAAARRADGRQRRGLCDQPGQPDLLAQGGGRIDQLVAARLARDRRNLRRGGARGRAGDGRRRLLVGRAQRLSLRERPAGLAGPARSGPASAPASRRYPTSTPIR